MVDPGIPNTALPILSMVSTVNSYPTSVSSANNIQGWENTVSTVASQSAAISSMRAAMLNTFMNPQIIFPEPALFAGIDYGALRPNLETINITTALQSPEWLSTVDMPQTPLFAGSDINALRPNTTWNVPNNYLQGAEWLQLPAQPALFVGSDIYALRPNLETINIVTALQSPTWMPGVSFAPQTPLFAGSDVYALFPNIETIVNLVDIQPPTWMPAVAFAPQTPLPAANIISAFWPNLNFWPVPIQPETEARSISVDEFLILIQKWWTRYPLQFFINVTEALGAVTESVVVTKIAGTIFFIANKIQMIIDQW